MHGLRELIKTENNPQSNEEFNNLLNLYTFEMGKTVNELNRIKVEHVNSFTRYSRFDTKDFEITQKYNLALMGVVFIMIGGITSVVIALNIKDKKELE